VEKTLSSQTLKMAVSALENLGVETKSILAELEVSRAKLINPLSRIPIKKEQQFWVIAVEKTSNPGIALQMAEQIPFGTFAVMEYLGASCQSLYQAMVFFCKYAELAYGGWSPSLQQENGNIYLDLGADSEISKCSNEFGLATLFNRLEYYSGRDAGLEAVHFKHALIGDIRKYEKFFKTKIFFNSDRDSLVFGERVKTIPCRNSSNLMLGSLLNLVEKLTGDLPKKAALKDSELIKSVKKVIESQLSLGEPEIDKIAREVAMSTRSFQRKLELEGTTLTKLISNVRKEMASQLLATNDLSNEEVALMLGYSTLSAFNRAFKQWFKMTPSQFRKTKL
jgi:AraC-like DNA-binding protein